MSLQQSERFDHLDQTHKDIIKALVGSETFSKLQVQISALSILLDRAEVVIAGHETATSNVFVDVFPGVAHIPECVEEGIAIDKARNNDKEIQEAIRNEVLQDLYFEAITERYAAVDEVHGKTFRWLFRHPEDTVQFRKGRRWSDFPVWLQSGKEIYWINGKAGSGKSTLMKYIFNSATTDKYLTRWAGRSKLCKVGFFFWNSGNTQQRSQLGLFRSLLYDVLRKNRDLIPILLPEQWAAKYSSKCQSLPSPVSNSLLENKISSCHTTC